MDATEAKELEHRAATFTARLNGRTSWRNEEVPAHVRPLTHAETSALEVYRFKRDRPADYFLYVNMKTLTVGTWTGEKLGRIVAKREPWYDNFGGQRQYIKVQAITGDYYAGTYYKSSGDYARVKKLKAVPLYPVTGIEAYAVITRAIHERGDIQAEAVAELARRGLWLNDEQKKQAELS